MAFVRGICFKRRLVLLVPVFLLCLAVAGPVSAQTCGDVDGSGVADATDIYVFIDHLYLTHTPLAVPSSADMDGVPGITNNDYLTLVENQFLSLVPLDCNVVPDSTFQVSADTVDIRNRIVPAGESEWVVEVWLKTVDSTAGFTLPLSYVCQTSSITLDSVNGDCSGIDTVNHRVLVARPGWDIYPPGEELQTQLFFSVTPKSFEQEILFDTTGYPPSHTTVLSRDGVGARGVDGFLPIILGLSDLEICGDLDLSGHADFTDIELMLAYLYLDRLPFPSSLWVADMDGVPGVTHNDYLTLVDNQFLSLTPLDCNVTPDSTFQVSDDSVLVLNTIVPPGLSEWTVEVRLNAIAGYLGMTLPFSFECATSPIMLDSITDAGSAFISIDTAGERGFIGRVAESWYSGGDQLVARLWFSVDAEVFPQEIVIDTSGFPPSHPLMLSRNGAEDRVYDGFTPTFVTAAEEGDCLADGDVNNSGMLDIADAAALTSFIYLGGTAPDPLYKADVTGDCVIDSLDVIAIACALFGGGCTPPALPVATCCRPQVLTVGDTALALGDAYITYQSDTMIINMDSEDSTGGVRIYGDETQSRGISVDLINADLSIPNAGLEFGFSGYVEGSEKMPQGGLQHMASIGIYNNGSGSLQVFGDFTPAGDPNVLVEVYYSGVGMTGSASIPGGGLIAFGNEYGGGGLPSVTKAAFQTAAPPTFAAKLSVVTEFTLVGGPVLVGDSIRLVGANANAITHCSTFDLNGLQITFLGLVNIKTNACCRGFTGNVDCDAVDAVDITDIQVLVDNQFLTLTPLCCPKEANFNYPGSGHTTTDNVVDITDLSILIDNQFLTLTPLPSCP